MPRPSRNITGNRYGRLTALERQPDGRWLMQCNCGNMKIARLSDLESGRTRSCGCIRNAYYHDGREAARHAMPEERARVARAKLRGMSTRTSFDGLTLDEWAQLLDMTPMEVLRQIVKFGRGESDAPQDPGEETGHEVQRPGGHRAGPDS